MKRDPGQKDPTKRTQLKGPNQKDPTKWTQATWTRTNQNNCTLYINTLCTVMYLSSKQCIVYGATKHSI